MIYFLHVDILVKENLIVYRVLQMKTKTLLRQLKKGSPTGTLSRCGSASFLALSDFRQTSGPKKRYQRQYIITQLLSANLNQNLHLQISPCGNITRETTERYTRTQDDDQNFSKIFGKIRRENIYYQRKI